MNSYEESKFFYLSSLTVILFNIFFIGFILKNGHKEYIPPAGVITYEYWNELVKNPELVDEVLASNVANISSVDTTHSSYSFYLIQDMSTAFHNVYPGVLYVYAASTD